jgi:hypothetical protein
MMAHASSPRLRLRQSHISEERLYSRKGWKREMRRAVSRRTDGICVPSPLAGPLRGKDRMGGRAMPRRLASLARSLEAAHRGFHGWSVARSSSRPCPTGDCGQAIAFPLRLRPSSASLAGMARPPILSFPHKGGRDASDGSPRPSPTNGCVNLVALTGRGRVRGRVVILGLRSFGDQSPSPSPQPSPRERGEGADEAPQCA